MRVPLASSRGTPWPQRAMGSGVGIAGKKQDEERRDTFASRDFRGPGRRIGFSIRFAQVQNIPEEPVLPSHAVTQSIGATTALPIAN